MQAVSTLQAARLQTADGAFAEMPRYVWQARFHLHGSRLLPKTEFFSLCFFSFYSSKRGRLGNIQ